MREKKAHQCSVCTQCFLEPEKLATHMHKFPICGMVLADQKKLKTHFAIVHEGKIPFKCPVCDENFSSRQNWKEHVRQMNHFQCKLWWEISGSSLLSFCQIREFSALSVCIFFEESVLIFQFLNDKMHNYVQNY